MNSSLFSGTPWGLAAFFAGVGVLHFAVTPAFMQIMPRWVPADGPLGRRALVLASGACEILGGLGVLFAPTRAAAGWWLILVVAGVFPANVEMLLDARRRRAAAWYQALLWARLPLQPLIMLWIYSAAVHGAVHGAVRGAGRA